MYVKRNAQGRIIAVSEEVTADFAETLPADHEELNRFFNGEGTERSTRQAFAESDLDFVRVVEDLVELLVEKNLICFTELPREAQKKMAARKSLRQGIVDKLDLLDMSQDDFGL